MNITWGNPSLLVPLAILVIVCNFFLIRNYFVQKRCARLLTSPQFESELLRNFSLRKKRVQVILICLALITLCIALARPQWSRKHESVLQVGRDIVIALDISRSMLAEDYKPNRLEHAKEKIRNLVSHTKLASDRVSLLIFSGNAFVLCPLTTDLTAFYLFLDSVNHETLSAGSTSLEKALEKIIEIYTHMLSKKSKIAVIFTDGEDFSQNLHDLKHKIQKLGLHVFTVGVGTTEGAPIPVISPDGKTLDYQKDNSGKIIISRLNQSLLHKLAQDTGAIYKNSSSDTSDITDIINQIEKFEKEQFNALKVPHIEEHYYYFAFISLVLLLIDWIL